MFIHKQTQKRVNPYASVELDGIRYPSYPRHLLEEIQDPQPPEDYSDETYYRTEQDDAPYIVYTKKSEEQLTHLANSKAVVAARAHLESTDYLFTVDKYAALTDERKAELTASREAARVTIREKSPAPIGA